MHTTDEIMNADTRPEVIAGFNTAT